MLRKAVARLRGLERFGRTDPGACAPGFMLAPASQANRDDLEQLGF